MQVYEADDQFGPQVNWDAVWYLNILNFPWRHTHRIRAMISFSGGEEDCGKIVI